MNSEWVVNIPYKYYLSADNEERHVVRKRSLGQNLFLVFDSTISLQAL